jgi:exodeoxyribonuclease VII large subunit
VDALLTLNRIPDIDVILLARGGGSIEDLWAFNSEALAQAIFTSRIPIVTGVGHETDFTIADFVADLRAPTPTAAAELVTMITITDLAIGLQNARVTLADAIEEMISTRSHQLELLDVGLHRLSPIQRVNNAIQTMDILRQRLDRTMQIHLQKMNIHLENLIARLETLSPNAVLRRGFTIISDSTSGQLVSQSKQTQANQAVNVRFIDGIVPARLNPTSKE